MCSEYVPARPLSLQEMIAAARTLKDFYFQTPSPHGGIETRIFPHGRAPVLVAAADDLRLIPAEFGLIPSWWRESMNRGKSKSKRPLFATHNARLDTITEKKSFSEYFREQHCIVPMDCFFESSLFGRRFAGHRLRIGAREPLFAAGIYSNWVDHETGEEITTFSVVTHNPPEIIFEAGHDRCPVFFSAEDARLWLLEIRSTEASRRFCLERNTAASVPFDVGVDRPLKPGWEKRAPSIDELNGIEVLLSS